MRPPVSLADHTIVTSQVYIHFLLKGETKKMNVLKLYAFAGLMASSQSESDKTGTDLKSSGRKVRRVERNNKSCQSMSRQPERLYL